MDLATLIQQYGLPTALAVYFIYRDYKTQKEYRQDLREMLMKATSALEKNTEVMQKLLMSRGM